MLFTNTTELRGFAEVTDVNFPAISRTIKFCERQYIVPLLGNTLYASLSAYYASKATQGYTPDTTLDAALDLCQCILGAYVTYHYYPIADVSLSDSGGRRDETGQMKSAYGNQKTDFRKENMLRAESYAEQLLEYLESNNVEDWQTSDAKAKYDNLFIKGGSDFNELYTTASPYRNYYAVRFKMTDVQEQGIRPAMQPATYTTLLTGTGLSDDQQQLLLAVKKAVAYLSVAAAVPFLNIRMDANGFTVANLYGQATSSNLETRGGASADMVTALQRSCEVSGQEWMQRVKGLVKTVEGSQSVSQGVSKSAGCGFEGMGGVWGLA